MRTILMIVLLLVAVACNHKSKVPSGVLPREKMEAVLWDILRADEMVNIQHTFDTTTNRFARSTELYQQIFRLHKINEQTFKKSFKYYQARPDLLKPVFDSLQKRGYTSPGARPVPALP